MKYVFDDKCKQWLADVYHCCETWGEKETSKTMFIMLAEHMKQKDPENFSPHPSLCRECAAYWNKLCDAYPN